MWLMLRALLVRWTFSSMGIVMVYWAPAAPMSVAVTLSADGLWQRAGLIGVEDASWQDVRRARAIVGRMVEPSIWTELSGGDEYWRLVVRDE
jgi:hypothetical protein